MVYVRFACFFFCLSPQKQVLLALIHFLIMKAILICICSADPGPVIMHGISLDVICNRVLLKLSCGNTDNLQIPLSHRGLVYKYYSCLWYSRQNILHFFLQNKSFGLENKCGGVTELPCLGF